MAWIGLASLVLSMDSFFWKRNTSNFAPIWCDISSKFLIGANAAISSVSLCINLRLWLVASDRVRTLEKRSVFVIELLLGLGFPVLEMTFQYFVQDRRFDIYEGVGCRAASDNVLLMYLLLLAPQFLLGIASTTFFILAFINYHRVYKYMLETQYSPTFHHRTTLSASFPCFITLGGISILCSIAYAAFVVYFNATASDTLGSFTLWESWTSTHLNIKKVNVYNEKEWRGDMMTVLLLEANRWIFVGLAFLFFVFFGLAREARRRYRRLFGCGGRRNYWFQADRTTVGAGDRGIVHYADGDTESAEGSSNRSESTFDTTTNFNASISKPQLVNESVVNVLPQDPFTLDNPYPKHIHDKKSEKDDSVIAVSKSEESTSLLPTDPFAAAPPSSLLTAPIPSTALLQTHQESTNSLSPSIRTPPSAYVPDREPPARGQVHFVFADEMRQTSLPPSFPAASTTTRGRSNSLGSRSAHTRRPTSRRRSLSRGLSATATSPPPTRPLPDIPSDIPLTPNTGRNFQSYHTDYMSQRSGSFIPSLISSPAATLAAAPSDVLTYHLSRRRTEGARLLVEGRAF
ncbi:pheromone A receptor-domain-containing protein [Lentinula boryana]|uniref:Pheromone A receptor-domain-containing protein n=1 Tax=Lentinula boryana TaxID=40481 RepID=A0ABQ8QF73_9AGAR|nr:pheromone A receptor-domain-containing protein [Lentinula boryana]